MSAPANRGRRLYGPAWRDRTSPLHHIRHWQEFELRPVLIGGGFAGYFSRVYKARAVSRRRSRSWECAAEEAACAAARLVRARGLCPCPSRRSGPGPGLPSPRPRSPRPRSPGPRPSGSSPGPARFPRRRVPVLVPSALVHVRRVCRPGPGPLTLRRAEERGWVSSVPSLRPRAGHAFSIPSVLLPLGAPSLPSL